MKAVKISDSAVTLGDIDDPVVGGSDLLVRVSYAGINAADLLQASGNYPAPAGTRQDVPGLEYSGQVVQQGQGVSETFTGRNVMGISPGAAQAEFIVARYDQVISLPSSYSLSDAGAIPEAFMTAHDAIFTQGKLTMGKRLLVTGATGGVGSAAVSLGVLAGAQVFGTSRSEDGKQFIQSLGAQGISSEQIEKHAPYDVVLELVGGVNFDNTLPSLAESGTIVVIGVSSSSSINLNLRLLMSKRGIIRGSTLRSRSLAEKAALAKHFEREIVPLFASGKLKPIISSIYRCDQVQDAYEAFAKMPKTGKLLLNFNQE